MAAVNGRAKRNASGPSEFDSKLPTNLNHLLLLSLHPLPLLALEENVAIPSSARSISMPNSGVARRKRRGRKLKQKRNDSSSTRRRTLLDLRIVQRSTSTRRIPLRSSHLSRRNR
jgi:hypothetical protein